MKTYKEIINYLANGMHGMYLSGCSDYRRYDAELVSYIYNVPINTICTEVDRLFKSKFKK